jgi:hypothetical protein
MHNCREAKEQFTELLLDGNDYRSHEALSAELGKCAECRAEFEALSATLRMATRSGEMAAPAETYWPGYHTKLRQRLVDAQARPTNSRARAQGRKEKLGPLFEPLRPGAGTSLLARFLKASVPVPLPLAVALIVTAALLLPFVIRAARREVQPSITTRIVRVPVEVPVVQEKVVTRVVYRDRALVVRTTKQPSATSTAESTFARSQKPRTETMPTSLTGFKPTDEVKLTVIKGGVPNEK